MEIQINGCIEVSVGMTLEKFENKFIDFLESNDCYFGGGINEYVDDEAQ